MICRYTICLIFAGIAANTPVSVARAEGATVTVVDSGVDLRHELLRRVAWTNLHEIDNNLEDDDGNGFVDDINGWNFAERNAQIIDYDHIDTFPDDCYTYFEVQSKVFLGTASESDKEWLRNARENTILMAHLRRFSNFVHGTHVAGILAGTLVNAKVTAAKLIPTGRVPRHDTKLKDDDDTVDARIQSVLDIIAKSNADLIVAAGRYGIVQGARVLNGSFGVTPTALRPTMDSLLRQLLGREAFDEELNHYINVLIEKLNAHCAEMLDEAPHVVFVFASGNDGADNDLAAVAPANIKRDHTISVAATVGRSALASFSSYGRQSVDVAAPGVAIKASVPGDRYLRMSGTSMAAPYVSHIAARILEIAPHLSAAQVKQIILGTVDKKDFLTDKVQSGGIANTLRAAAAAGFARSLPVSTSVFIARRLVADMPEHLKIVLEASSNDKVLHDLARPLPLPSPLSWMIE